MCTIHNVTHDGWAADVEVPGCALEAGGSALREGGWVPQGGSVPGKGGWAPGEGSSVPAVAPLEVTMATLASLESVNIS